MTNVNSRRTEIHLRFCWLTTRPSLSQSLSPLQAHIPRTHCQSVNDAKRVWTKTEFLAAEVCWLLSKSHWLLYISTCFSSLEIVSSLDHHNFIRQLGNPKIILGHYKDNMSQMITILVITTTISAQYRRNNATAWQSRWSSADLARNNCNSIVRKVSTKH